ncbi:MAG: asparagine synthase-related protein [Nitrososphaerota archaeon]
MENFSSEIYDLLKEVTLNCRSECISLSGGLDSSILAYYLKGKIITPIAIIAKDFVATDLTYCQMIAKNFDFKLYLKTVTTEELLKGIEDTIKILKIFNDIEIRNAIVMYIALNVAKEKGFTSIITGDGADELFAGYNFLLRKNDYDAQKDLERIWKIMHFPTEKIGTALGIKVESPFLDSKVRKFAENLPINMKIRDEDGKKYGKWILRKTYEQKIPKSVVWRDKSPMQDGSGTSGLVALFDSLISDEMFNIKTKEIQSADKVKIRTKESLHYYTVYRKYYEPPHTLHVLPRKCSFCQYSIDENSKFCRMCGSYPV